MSTPEDEPFWVVFWAGGSPASRARMVDYIISIFEQVAQIGELAC